MSKHGINIGHNAKAARKFEKMLLATLNTSAGDNVKLAAIEAIKAQYTINNVSISGCSVDMQTYNTYDSTPEVLED